MIDSQIEAGARILCFFAVLLLMMLWEWRAPRRADILRRERWPANLGIVVFNTLFVRVVIPMVPVAFAVWCEAQGWGLWNMLSAPLWLALPLSLILFDFAIYWQHRAMHALPVLWRLHRMHHADTGFDVTTGARFHPFEIIVSLIYKLAIVLALGAPALAVLAFEILLNASSMFNHGNVRMPDSVERRLRRVIVTPDMHRVHHSAVRNETDSNFGFNLSVWDRLFRTYTPRPALGHKNMKIGLDQFREPAEQGLWHLLTQPFRNSAP